MTGDDPTTTSQTAPVFTVVDVETTGLNPDQHRVIQVAALRMNFRGEVLDTFQSIVRPECPAEYEHGAEHIHGISQEDVSHGMPLRDALHKLGESLSDSVLVGHNAKFDIGFLRAESQRIGYELPIRAHIDTLKLSRALDIDNKHSHRLSDVCERYEIAINKAHDAAEDAGATASLLMKMLSELGVTSPDQLPTLFSE